MKKVILLFFSILCVAVTSLLFTACSNDTKDEMQNTGDDGYSILSARDFTVSGLEGRTAVSHETSQFSFKDRIEVSDGATWVMTLDEVGITTILSKEISLSCGHNYVYIWVMNNNQTKKYTFNVHRNYIMNVRFNVNGGQPIPQTQHVEEGGYIIQPETPTRSGYSFDSWSYDFSQPIPTYQASEDFTISAFWIGANFFDITSDGVLSLTDYGRTQSTLIIPEKVNNIVVTSIVDHFAITYFYNTTLTSVTLPNTLQHIQDSAFYNCVNLTHINLPESLLSIGENAFCNDTKLTEYSFGDKLLKIGEYAFYGTTPKTITIPENITEIGFNAFGNNANLETINYNAIEATAPAFLKSTSKILDVTINIGENVEVIPASFAFCEFGVNYAYDHLVELNFLGNNVKTIGSRAFYNCKIRDLNLPNSLTYIGNEAFLNAQVSYKQILSIPENVTFIGRRAFDYCLFETINYNAIKAEIPEVIFGGDYRCYRPVVLNIGERVSYLPQNLFIYSDGLSNHPTQYFITELNFDENNVMTELRDIVLCDPLYPYYAGDLSLTTITLSKNLLSIGADMFKYTKDLKTVRYFGTAEQFADIVMGINNTYMESATKIFNFQFMKNVERSNSI